ncbi:cytochrome c maturation protein CcmE [Aestuariibacter sp. AA17]|uniref:Cytochrome c-type biogenesis protein CcmE n=1 Tax=Fluctibacter corallii TaxID=2984329 RepID=A0ABT3A3X6_9ALTE|nr:cytochrome c maturation protein CcmE [Aestuariibacter sp. AA17]MCV2883303.1 cytochrome c maturation protein CcmE [Aestuariibacter sp. AA17]
MITRRQKRLLSFSAVILIFGAAVATMLYALNQNIDLFYTPSEIIEGKEGHTPAVGQRLRIGGMVVPGSVVRDENSLAVRFDLVDTGPKVTVVYEGLLPDLFREGQGIVATGRLEGSNVIVAEEVLAKHDEEYMPAELAEKMKGIKHVNPNATSAGY